MKRYLVFFGDIYYAAGGMKDFVGDFDDLQAAVSYLKGRVDFLTWGHVYDMQQRKVVHEAVCR